MNKVVAGSRAWGAGIVVPALVSALVGHCLSLRSTAKAA